MSALYSYRTFEIHYLHLSSLGQVGIPLPSVQVKLVDVPEMEYYAAEDKGEVRK